MGTRRGLAMAVPSTAVWLVVAFAQSLVGLASAMESRGDAISLDAATLQAPKVAADLGYSELKGYVQVANSERMYQPSQADCQKQCDDDVNCASYSWNQEHKDCFTARSAVSYNPSFNYYSRLSKKARDEGAASWGSVLGNYAVFNGMIFPRRARFKERNGVSLESCMQMCNDDPPRITSSKEKLYQFNPDQQNYNREDGCSAFSYSAKIQLCLLNGDPVSYAPGYNYYVKRGVEETTISRKSASEDAAATPKGKNMSDEKNAAKNEEKKVEKAEAQKAETEAKMADQAVEKEQAKVKEEAEQTAEAEAEAAQKAKNDSAPPPVKKPTEEQKTKEKTKKDLDKERRLRNKMDARKEKSLKEKQAKEVAKENQESAMKLTARSKEMKQKENHRKMQGNLGSLLNEMVDKSQLIAQSERDLKAAMKNSKEHDTKEKLVKLKVRKARMERFEREKQGLQANEKSAESNAAATMAADKTRLAEEGVAAADKKSDLKDKQEEAKDAKERLNDAQAKLDKLHKALDEKKEILPSAIGRDKAKLDAEILSIENDKIPDAENKVADAKGEVKIAQAEIKKAKKELNRALKEAAAGKISVEEAESQMSELKNSLNYVLDGMRPVRPSPEDAELYRMFSKEVGLPIPGEASATPVVTPADPNASPQQSMDDAEKDEADAIKEAESEDDAKVASDEAAAAAAGAG